MKSMGGIAYSVGGDLLVRAADVILKERKKLVLVVRETPLHLGHLESMVHLTRMGAVILPPVPAFYHRPKTLDDVINQTVTRILDQFGIDVNLFERWSDEQLRRHPDAMEAAESQLAGSKPAALRSIRAEPERAPIARKQPLKKSR
jgi:4-hydroxy-3-polyprenylbenzoate decarboxylase